MSQIIINEKFPFVNLKGNPQDIGFQHGKILKNRIHQTIDFYKRIFKKDKKAIFDAAKNYRSKIHEFNEAYCEEIEWIARGAEVGNC